MSAKQTQVNNPQKPKEVKKPEVEKEERKQTPPPVDPAVETVATEEVKPEPKEEIPSKIDLNNIKLQPHQRMSGDGYARLLEVAQRHIAGMKSGEPATIKMEQAFTYNLAWGMTKASIQAREEKLELGLAVPNDDVIVQDVINTADNAKQLSCMCMRAGKQNNRFDFNCFFRQTGAATQWFLRDRGRSTQSPPARRTLLRCASDKLWHLPAACRNLSRPRWIRSSRARFHKSAHSRPPHQHRKAEYRFGCRRAAYSPRRY